MEHLTLPLRLMHGGPASTGSPMPGAPLPALPHKGGGGGAHPVSAAYAARNGAVA
jgi:hypothetical protein